MPRPHTSGARAEGRFGKQDFVYVAEQDVYRRPGGQLLQHHMTTVEKGLTLHRYWDRASRQARHLKPQCTPSVERWVTRWEHEAVIEVMQRRLDLAPYGMRTRAGSIRPEGLFANERRQNERLFVAAHGEHMKWLGAAALLCASSKAHYLCFAACAKRHGAHDLELARSSAELAFAASGFVNVGEQLCGLIAYA